MTRSAERGSASAAAAQRTSRRLSNRPPPLLVPVRSTRSENASSLPAYCYEVAQPSLPVPVAWPAEGPPAAAATRRGARRPVNEDRVFADARAGIYGVCDGHGGEQAAEFVADALVARVPFDDDPESVCNAFQNLNCCLLSELPDTQYVGTTVTAVAVHPGQCLRLIHLGDCRAVLIDAGGIAHSLTVDHCPSRQDESNRIAGAGGAVLNGRVNGVLAVSRALGDNALKNVLSPIPDVIDRALSTSDHLLVVGSDGFFDCVSNADLAAELANMHVVPGTSAVPVNLKAAVLSLINLAVARRSTDDISLVLIDIRVPTSTSSSSRQR